MSDEIVTRSFAVIVNGEVVTTIHVPNAYPIHERLWAGFSSNPIIVESTHNPLVNYGWTYDGTDFIEPESN